MYIVLGGYRPFRGTSDQVMKQIRYGEYEFHPRYWSHVSKEAKALITCMLTVDPDERISATDALKSAWITADDSTLGKSDLSSNLQELKHFKAKAKLRQVVKVVSEGTELSTNLGVRALSDIVLKKIIATNKLQSLGSRYRAFKDF